MADCLCTDCRKPCAKRLFCRECSRLLTDDQVWMIRMTYRSPMHSNLRPAKGAAGQRGEWIGMAGWGNSMDGTEEMMIRWEEQGLPCFHRVRGVGKITPVLHELEYRLVLAATADAITERRRRNRARLQSRHPKTWMHR